MRSRRWVVALVVPLLLASGCGDEASTAADHSDHTDHTASPSSSATPSESPSESPAADLPACGQVWKDGTKLPRDYAGCTQGGSAVEPDQRECSFGKALVTYDDHFYAVRGGTIHRTSTPLEKDKGYRSALASCTA